MKTQLVLSIFPGLGIWERAFVELGWCVVRGPEKLLGGDIKDFTAMAGKFDGVIGGIPCQAFSKARNVGDPSKMTERFGDLTPEFDRIIQEAAPAWWLSENVPEAPVPANAVFAEVLNSADFGATQSRRRRFCSNLLLMPKPIERYRDLWPTVTATEHKIAKTKSTGSVRARAGRKVGRRMTLPEINESFGMPPDWQTPCLTTAYQYHMRGNAVPLPMARALAIAIQEALERTAK